MIESGLCYVDVAVQFGVSQWTIKLFVRRYRITGSTVDLPRSGIITPNDAIAGFKQAHRLIYEQVDAVATESVSNRLTDRC